MQDVLACQDEVQISVNKILLKPNMIIILMKDTSNRD